jgi:hypothetical protein
MNVFCLKKILSYYRKKSRIIGIYERTLASSGGAPFDGDIPSSQKAPLKARGPHQSIIQLLIAIERTSSLSSTTFKHGQQYQLVSQRRGICGGCSAVFRWPQAAGCCQGLRLGRQCCRPSHCAPWRPAGPV